VERFPVVREQFGEPIHRMQGNTREHIAELGERLNAATLAAGNEAHQDSRCPAAFIAPEERPLAPSMKLNP
jgi:hypothetical protein